MTMMARRSARLELGEFFRAQRARLTPAMLGFEGGRAPPNAGAASRGGGAALRAFDHLVHLARAGARHLALGPCAGAAGRRCCASPAERAYLFDLAGKRDPRTAPDGRPRRPRAPRRARLIDCPAYVIDHRWDGARLEQAGRPRVLFVGWLGPATEQRNLLRFIFLDPAARA